MPFTVSSYAPMSRISMDTVGPLPTSEEGYTHALVIIDSFTRFCEIYPIRSTGAAEAAQCLINFLGRYGEPDQIISDRGTQFLNQIFHHMAVSIDYNLEHVLAGSKEENGIVERAIREVLRHLIAIVTHKRVHKIWATCLPLVQRIMNSTVHSALGVSPAQLLFGNAVTLERGLFKQNQFKTADTPTKVSTESGAFRGDTKTVRTWLDKMYTYQQAVIDAAIDTISTRDIKNLEARSPLKPTVYPANSYVLVSYPKTAMGKKAPTKLTPPLRGPLRVVSYEHNEYTLYNLVTGRLEVQHVTSLRPYYYNPKNTTEKDLVEIAREEAGEFLVEAILEHTGSPTDKTKMDFLVRWQGLSDDYNLWIPWSEIRDNPLLPPYAKTHGLNLRLNKRESDVVETPETTNVRMQTRASRRVHFTTDEITNELAKRLTFNA